MLYTWNCHKVICHLYLFKNCILTSCAPSVSQLVRTACKAGGLGSGRQDQFRPQTEVSEKKIINPFHISYWTSLGQRNLWSHSPQFERVEEPVEHQIGWSSGLVTSQWPWMSAAARYLLSPQEGRIKAHLKLLCPNTPFRQAQNVRFRAPATSERANLVEKVRWPVSPSGLQVPASWMTGTHHRKNQHKLCCMAPFRCLPILTRFC